MSNFAADCRLMCSDNQTSSISIKSDMRSVTLYDMRAGGGVNVTEIFNHIAVRTPGIVASRSAHTHTHAKTQ